MEEATKRIKELEKQISNLEHEVSYGDRLSWREARNQLPALKTELAKLRAEYPEALHA